MGRAGAGRAPRWPFRTSGAGTGPLALRGRIDRLDYHPENADLMVWDYKSGEIPKKRQGVG